MVSAATPSFLVFTVFFILSISSCFLILLWKMLSVVCGRLGVCVCVFLAEVACGLQGGCSASGFYLVTCEWIKHPRNYAAQPPHPPARGGCGAMLGLGPSTSPASWLGLPASIHSLHHLNSIWPSTPLKLHFESPAQPRHNTFLSVMERNRMKRLYLHSRVYLFYHFIYFILITGTGKG